MTAPPLTTFEHLYILVETPVLQ